VTKIAALVLTERFTVQSVAMSVPEAVAALVADEVDLDKARAGLVPFQLGPYRDLGLEQKPGLGVAVATQAGEGLYALKAAIDSRRAHLHEQLSLGVGELELTDTPGNGMRTASIGASRLPAGTCATRQHNPRAETTQAEQTGVRGAGRAPGGSRRHREVPVPAGELEQPVEDRTLLRPRRPPIGRRHLGRDLASPAHR
jgi:hypothetical protein